MKPYQWLAWIATAMLLASASLAALNIYPYYAYGFILANATWAIVGVIWKEKSLIWSNLGLNAIYVAGLLLH
jgi:hypothetical protein